MAALSHFLNRTLSSLRHPGFRRSQLLRRVLALGIVACALALTALDKQRSTATVVVAARPISAGNPIGEHDLAVRQYPVELVPEGALEDPEAPVGRIASSTMGTGTPLAMENLVALEATHTVVENSTESPSSEPFNMVPIKLADPAVARLLVRGDLVTIISGEDEGDTGDVIATGGRVIFTNSNDSTEGTIPAGTVMIALPESHAQAVATASLNKPLTVTLSGSRANLK